MWTVKDRVLYRLKVYNVTELVDFVTTRVEAYYVCHLTDVANHRTTNYLQSKYVLQDNDIDSNLIVKVGVYKTSDTLVTSSPCAKNLGVVMDNRLSLSKNIAAVSVHISACLADISAWMSTHHLKLNLGKTELLFLPAKSSPMIDALITMEGSIVSPSLSARSLGVTLNTQLCFSGHIAAITRTC
ncbi:hypothetical protein AAFF_G00370590 [Aldrovandia affinis]|uniref:Uncharacterized protein n=1 Tax=Aldrovandia affinis TaxID=143900 RepID=A0AAD7WN59_9TELE|nr:hypothetical protein AAFF_G00370590 [Aldrovandia affinis]